jgi:hypothetical protein
MTVNFRNKKTLTLKKLPKNLKLKSRKTIKKAIANSVTLFAVESNEKI